jgi:cyclically-permuted mutarotase family protein
MRRRLFFLFLLTGLVNVSPISAQKKIMVKWSVATELPAIDGKKQNPGLAGAFAGVHHDVLMIAGGANFPDGMPWEGGKKEYHDDIYVFQKSKTGKFAAIVYKKIKLSQKIAYGASVSTTEGVVCIGGENEKGISNKVFLLQWDQGAEKVLIKDLPGIPTGVTNPSAATDGKIIYVAGGESINGVANLFFYLDLNHAKAGWKQLPVLPKPVSNTVMVMQSNGRHKCIYLVGGRRKNPNGISDLYSSVFEFDLKTRAWKEKASLPYALSAGTGIATEADKILLFGGDKGIVFNKTEELIAAINAEKDGLKKQQLAEEKNQLQITHPGFSKEELIYDTKENKWSVIGSIPFAVPVTAAAVKWGNDVFLTSGEIKAGVRTPQILLGQIENK